MLEETGKLRKGETVLITAAAGGAGHFAVQLAKLAGCTVIGTCSSAEKAAVLRELGCDHIINHRTQDVAAELLKIAPEGLDVVLEGVGGQMLKTALGSLGPKGRLLQVGYISEYPHNKNREAEAAHHGEDTASLFWKAETIHRADQVHVAKIRCVYQQGRSRHLPAPYSSVPTHPPATAAHELPPAQVIYGNAWPKDFGLVMAKKDRVLGLHKEGKVRIRSQP